MNGTRAKKLRQQAFRDCNGEPTQYQIQTFIRQYWVNRHGKRVLKELSKHTVFCVGFKRVYRDLKKEYKQGRRANEK